MVRRLLESRIQSLSKSQGWQWPPSGFVIYYLDLTLDEICDRLRSAYPDYHRQKRGQFMKFLSLLANQNSSNTLNRHVSNLYEKTKSVKEADDFEIFPETGIKTRLSDVGGIDSLLVEIRDLIIRPLMYPKLYTHLGIQPTRNVLLHGPPGSGKTKLAEAIAGEIQCPFFRVTATEIVSGMSGESESRLRTLFQTARQYEPCIIFLDELDAITPKRENASREMEKRIVAQLGACLDQLSESYVIVIGATNRPESVDPMIRRNGRFDKELALGIPDLKARESIFNSLVKNVKTGTLDLHKLAVKTPGFVGADLYSVTREAAVVAINRIFDTHDPDMFKEPDKLLKETDKLSILQEDFELAITKVQPSAKREGFATIPDVTWAEVGALSDLKRELEERIVSPIKYKELYTKFGIGIPVGVLLYGPPGCGKTLMAKAIARESNANFIAVKGEAKGPELLNKYLGESERAVRLIFQRAASSAPCIIFFDEIDSICPKRGLDNNLASERVVNQLLTEMDGIQSREDVYVIAATNRPDILDPAMLRPGRLDKLFYVSLPDEQSRFEILKTVTKQMPIDDNIDFKRFAKETKGYSGADLACLAREAALCTLEGIKLTNKEVKMSNIHFEKALSKMKPSVSQDDLKLYSNLDPAHRF